MPTPDDAILPFSLARSNMRGRVVRLDRTLQTILDQHRYPPAVSALIAEAALLTALIGQTMKLRWRFSLQVRGEGIVRMIATDYFAPVAEGEPARIRAYASFDRGEVASSRQTPFEMLGQGVIGITIDQGADMRPYQGITPLSGQTLSHCAETYFAQSEQIATRFQMISAEVQEPGGAKHWRAGGIMLQQMPDAGGVAPDAPSGEHGLMSADDVAEMGSRTEDWTRATTLLDTADAHELIGPTVSPETLLFRLFHEEVPSVFDAQPIEFGCTCSAEKVESAMYMYSAKDLTHMTNEDGMLTADCQFCGAHYEFDPKTLGFESERDVEDDLRSGA
ncbi:MAG: Hsp33 family molecular chaperone HslO [Pseudomonadota bacterium]